MESASDVDLTDAEETTWKSNLHLPGTVPVTGRIYNMLKVVVVTRCDISLQHKVQGPNQP